MTGSAVTAVDVGSEISFLFEKGEGPGRGGTEIGPERSLADDGKRCYSGERWS